MAPLLNGYIGSGGFTVPQKLLLSLKDNAIQYSIVGGIGIIAIIVIAVSQNMGLYAPHCAHSAVAC